MFDRFYTQAATIISIIESFYCGSGINMILQKAVWEIASKLGVWIYLIPWFDIHKYKLLYRAVHQSFVQNNHLTPGINSKNSRFVIE